jgi:uncharacterized protein YneF (UPF0154 family)
MISGGDLAVFILAVGIVVGFFLVLRWFMRKAEKSDSAAKHH